MKVLNLRCAHEHRFEGWFKSVDEMRVQLDDGTLVCPLCGDADIVRLPSAPHVVVSGGAARPLSSSSSHAPGAASAAAADGGQPDKTGRNDATGGAGTDPGARATVPAGGTAGGAVAAVQAAWLQRLRRVIESTDDVGDRFATEARRMHYGEAEERAIRGRATKEEARALVDEGIEVVALPTPEALKGTLQ